MNADLERIVRPLPGTFLEPGEFVKSADSLRDSSRLSGLSALVVDASDKSGWGVFKILQRSVLHLGALSIATLFKNLGMDSKAVYEVLTPDFYYFIRSFFHYYLPRLFVFRMD